ncbi:MAG TPA: S9 family peptidase [Bacteroidetes bacterium]|nr:S9 family peptidase [Bacteroidota bacterium]
MYSAVKSALFFVTSGVILFSLLSCSGKIKYPVTKEVDVVDDYHGTKVADPYRWLEDDNSAETKQWVEAENKVTFAYLKKIPQRKKIEKRLTELWDYEKYSLPYKEGGLYFFSKNDGLQNQPVLYVQESFEAEPRVLIDPNKFSEDGTIALTTTSVSKNGKYIMYGTASGGSDWQEFKVKEIATGKDLADHLKWIKFSGGSWSRDSQGFYYSRYPEPKEGEELQQQNRFPKVYFHRVGTDQSDDELIYEDPTQPDWGFSAFVTDDGRYLVLHVWQGTDRRNRIYYVKLNGSRQGRVIKLLNDFDAGYQYIDNDGSLFYFQTDLNAPKSKVIAIDVRRPNRLNWKTVIPERDDVLSGVNVINNKLVAVYMHNAHNLIKIFEKSGSLVNEVALPAIGSVAGISGKKEDSEMFYGFTSFSYPTRHYRYDFAAGESTLFRSPEVKFNPEDFETQQIFCESKGGVKVPIFITYKKGIDLKSGNNPTYLYGYGGFNISLTPSFSVSNLQWMEMGGIYAMANIRGGGEYGVEWYKQGTLANKQNVFNDFIAAAEYLIAEGYTSKEKLAIGGGSNGGLLVGACMTQRPDLYAAALPAVGVMDMLRYHKFTIGWAWASDYGRSDDPEQFMFLYAYSPYHNLKEGTCYPATLVTTADHDDRVVPAHSFKFAARLQKCQICDKPVLIRIETRAGHGAGKPTGKQIEEQADKWAFLVKNLEMK